MYHCTVCNKAYKRLRYFQEHRAICEAKQASEGTDTTHLHEVPSQLDMWLALKYYIKRCSALENKVNHLEKWAIRQKKKVNIMDWLNEHFKPKLSFNDWIDDFRITQEDLDLIFDLNFIGGMYKIIERRILNVDKKDLPVKAFSQYLNMLFIWNGSSWDSIDSEDMEKQIVSIHNKLQQQLRLYKRENEMLINDPNLNVGWYKNIRKIMGGPEPYASSIRKISLKMYTHLKFNLKKVVEYEFTF